jgi:hypothetical protein
MLATSHFFPPCLKDAAVLDISPVDFHEKTEMENSIVLHLHFSKTPWGKSKMVEMLKDQWLPWFQGVRVAV